MSKSTLSYSYESNPDVQSNSTSNIFDRFVGMLPNKPYCTDYLPWGVQIRSKDCAIKRSYLQINTKFRVNALVLDLDHDFSVIKYEDANLPIPTFIVKNQENGHAHYIYLLSSPVYGNQEKAMRYFRAIRDKYTLILDADPNYTGLMVKNPLSTTRAHYMWWETFSTNKTFSLDELAEYVEELDAVGCKKELYKKRKSAWIDSENAQKGRNCKLFEVARQFAYNVVSFSTSRDDLNKRLLQYVETHNTGGLSTCEEKSISRSISKWTWKNRNHFINRNKKKKLDLDPSRSLQERQREGASFTNEKQRSETEAKILSAITMLSAQNQRQTKTAVAKLCGVSRDTVHRYSHLFSR